MHVKEETDLKDPETFKFPEAALGFQVSILYSLINIFSVIGADE